MCAQPEQNDKSTTVCIAGNFGVSKFWRMTQVLHFGECLTILPNSPKFPPAKITRYTVSYIDIDSRYYTS